MTTPNSNCPHHRCDKPWDMHLLGDGGWVCPKNQYEHVTVDQEILDRAFNTYMSCGLPSRQALEIVVKELFDSFRGLGYGVESPIERSTT